MWQAATASNQVVIPVSQTASSVFYRMILSMKIIFRRRTRSIIEKQI